MPPSIPSPLISTRSISLLRRVRHPPTIRKTFSTVIDGPIPQPPESMTQQSLGLQEAIRANGPRSDWEKKEIETIYNTPLMKLAYAAGTVHRRFHDPSSIQMCTLMNIKTGGCSEDCSYCAQSSRYNTGLQATKMVTVDSVLAAARTAKDNGSTRFCMGAAWRDMRGRKTNLRNIKEMVNGVRDMGMEVCVTLGMIDLHQAKELKEAGLTAYNHNVDTSREFYPSVITTRTYDERLQTLDHVRNAGLNVCTGGILGLGEKSRDHVGLIHTVATLPAHPESFPVNTLTIIRIAAGRTTLSEEQQVLCFMAGANAIFTGEKMLTTECNGWDEDKAMFEKWGMRPMRSFTRGKEVAEAGTELPVFAAGAEVERGGEGALKLEAF
ncbi:MAG: biotin synthase [Lasallia pustulata]|uniref:Biotin synthase n=1 Tax=Lasallia pustulata TaxID=136370 RepID=A0A5M8PDC6_9LECA|nr:MAG: biotin synthase [Lasallia pustulata]